MPHSTGTLISADHPTAPLPAIAVDAMRRLELALATPDVIRAVTRYEIASARTAELSAMDAREMSGAEFDSLALAQDVMAEAHSVLAAAGLLHLIEVTR